MLPDISQTINFFILQLVAMCVITFLLPKLKITNIFGVLGIVLALSLINSTLWDSALFHKLPDFTTSKGIVLIAINGLIFFILVKILPGIEIDGLLPAVLAPIAYSISTILIQTYAGDFDFMEFSSSALDFFAQLKSYFFESTSQTNPKP